MPKTFVTLPIVDWDIHFVHRFSTIRVRSGFSNKFVEAVVRSDDPRHRPYYGRVPENEVFMHGETNDGKAQIILTCHPWDREAVEAKMKSSGGTMVNIEPAPGRNITNVSEV